MMEKKASKNPTKADSVKALLSTPTNNFGLGLFFKKFLILNED